MANDNRPATPMGVGAKPWIKMRTDLWDDPRTSALCDALDADEARVIGGLYRLWSLADSHSTDGLLPWWTEVMVDRKCGIPGFGNALDSIGWIVTDDTGVTIPDFEVHNGQSAKSRAQNCLRQQARRSRQQSEADVSRTKRDSNASGTRQRSVTGMTNKEESRDLEKNSEESPPPPSNRTSGEFAKLELLGDADQWGKVEEELISAGVSHWRGLLSSYRETGCSAEHGQALIEFWKRHQDRFDSPIGALHHRMENAHPSIPTDDRWPGLQEKHRPKTAPDIEVGRYAADWSLLRPSRRAELARQAQIDLSGHEGQGLRELPSALQKPIIEILARGAEQKPSPKPEA